MFDRFTRRIVPAFMASFLNSRRAKGQLRFFDAQDYLWDQWDEYLGEQDVLETGDAMMDFFESRFGVEVEGLFNDGPTGILSEEQQQRAIELIARQLLAQGAVHFS